MADVSPPLPHDEGAERSLLGAILLDPSILEHATEMLDASSFYFERNQAIWRAFVALRKRSEPIDYKTVESELRIAGALEKVGGMAYLVALDELLPVSGIPAVRGYAEVIRDRHARRRLIAAGIRLRDMAQDGHETSEAISAASSALEEIERGRSSGLGQDENLLDMLVSYEAFDPPAAAGGIMTGLVDLDRRLRGMRPGQLWVVGATPGMGKTAFGLQVARHAAAAGARVRYQALEMTSSEMMFRMLSQESGVPFGRILDGEMSDDEKHRVIQANIQLTRAVGDRIVMRCMSGLNAGQIAAEASLQKLRHGLDLLIVDNLGLIHHPGREDLRVATGRKCEALKHLAMQLDVPLLLFHHLSRQHVVDSRPPRMQDLIETQAVERDAHAVILIWRPEELLKNLIGDARKKAEQKLLDEGWLGHAAFIVGKNRNGPTGKVKCAWVGERMRFYDLDEREPPRGPGQEEMPF